MIFTIASMAEATGQTVVNAEIVGKKIDVKTAATRTIRGDGLTSLLGGLFGTPLMVTSGENIGIVRVSGVRSRFVTLGAGLVLIVIGVVAPIGRAISLIPRPWSAAPPWSSTPSCSGWESRCSARSTSTSSPTW